jgi:hypothetical protein
MKVFECFMQVVWLSVAEQQNTPNLMGLKIFLFYLTSLWDRGSDLSWMIQKSYGSILLADGLIWRV